MAINNTLASNFVTELLAIALSKRTIFDIVRQYMKFSYFQIESEKKLWQWVTVREYILAFDPDEAGRKATERFRKNVHGKIIKELVYPDNRDINDLQEEFLNCKIIF